MNTSFISTQQIKDLINEQKFTSTQQTMDCMKSMFAGDIKEQIKGLYDVAISEKLVSKISEHILSEVKPMVGLHFRNLLSLRLNGCHSLQDP